MNPSIMCMWRHWKRRLNAGCLRRITDGELEAIEQMEQGILDIEATSTKAVCCQLAVFWHMWRPHLELEDDPCTEALKRLLRRAEDVLR